MKGAIADPCDNTINVPSNSKTIIIGASQNFFLAFIYPHKSLNNSNINSTSPYRFLGNTDSQSSKKTAFYRSFSYSLGLYQLA